MQSIKSFRARVVFPVNAAPIRNGCVAICDERIVSVGAETNGIPVRDLGNVAILPGLVNAHTHLEFSDLPGPLGQRGMSLPDWIRLVVAHRRNNATPQDSISIGLHESLNAGVTALGEIASPGPWPDEFSRTQVEATVFRELIGLKHSLVEPKLSDAADYLSRPRDVAARWHLGLSPHAPYSVHPELVRRSIELAASAHAPVAFHLAESPAELELLRLGTGPFRPLLEELSAWSGDAIRLGSRPLDYLRLLAMAQWSLVIHGNYLDEEELAFVAEHRDRMSVVYCPRTHDYFGHAPYPLGRMIDQGVQVALGTDSRASNPDLSLLAEMRFAAARHPHVAPAKILECGTLGGARALGRDREIGSLAANKLANLTVVPLPDSAAQDPYELLFDSALNTCVTMCHGQIVTDWTGRSLL